MARRKGDAPKGQRRMWVIFAAPENRTPGGFNLFFAPDGTKTKSWKQAQKFYTHESALAFAKKTRIDLDGAMRYIGLIDFDKSGLGDEN